MKTLSMKLKICAALGLLTFGFAGLATAQTQQEGLGLPGDNLNLSAVLDVFQQSKTLEEFEASINSESNKINNLDLNFDGRTDYIKVNDFPDGKLHSIVLQVDVSQNESQDVAVIYTEKRSNGTVDVQIVGDEDLYGKNYVIDLGNNSGGTPNPGYRGNSNYNNYNSYDYSYNDYNDYGYYGYNYVAPASWGIIVYMYSPSYVRWYSPWYWGYYPRVWRPWRTFFWNDYYYHCYNNYGWHYRNYCYSSRNRFRNHHSNWYHRNRHYSTVYHHNRDRGVYNKSYQGNPPVRKPVIGKQVAVAQNFNRNNERMQQNGNQINRGNDRMNQNGRNNATQRMDRKSIQNIDRQDNRQMNENRNMNDRMNNTGRPQQQPQEISRQQMPRTREMDRTNVQPRTPEMNRQQSQPRQEMSRPQPERRPEMNRPQPEPRQEMSRPQPRQEMSRPQPRQEMSRPEPRPQMNRQESRSFSSPSPRPVQSQPRSDHPQGGRPHR